MVTSVCQPCSLTVPILPQSSGCPSQAGWNSWSWQKAGPLDLPSPDPNRTFQSAFLWFRHLIHFRHNPTELLSLSHVSLLPTLGLSVPFTLESKSYLSFKCPLFHKSTYSLPSWAGGHLFQWLPLLALYVHVFWGTNFVIWVDFSHRWTDRFPRAKWLATSPCTRPNRKSALTVCSG